VPLSVPWSLRSRPMESILKLLITRFNASRATAHSSARRGRQRRSIVLVELLFLTLTLQNVCGLGVTLNYWYTATESCVPRNTEDHADLYASIIIGPNVPDGEYVVIVQNDTFVRYRVCGGQTSPNPLLIWGADGLGNAAVFRYSITGNGAFDAKEWAVTKPLGVEVTPDCPPPPLNLTSVVHVLLGASSTHLTNRSPKAGGNQCSFDMSPMARYSVHSEDVSLNVEDRPLRYAPPRGPAIDFIVTYNQKETDQPATFAYSNLGPKWTFNWLGYVTDYHTTDLNGIISSIELPVTPVFEPGGGVRAFVSDGTPDNFFPDPQTHAVLVHAGVNRYEERFPDGSVWVFAQPDNTTTGFRKVFLTEVIDPAGQKAVIHYDSSLRVDHITDALGQNTMVYYDGLDPLKITRVTDPFGVRSAHFAYDGSGKLSMITDEIGIQSVFQYDSGTDSMRTLTTPYGTTSFASGEAGTNRWIEITDPLGGKERVEYRDQAPGILGTESTVPPEMASANTDLDRRNTFYWNKKAMSVMPRDYTTAKITHWLLLTNDGSAASAVPASEKMPLENRVWYAYPGQADLLHAGTSESPSYVGRVLADGTTQKTLYEYNDFGKMTKSTDPEGRVMTYVYHANGIDLHEIRQTKSGSNELLRRLEDYTLHKPMTEVDAAGQPTTYLYNEFGQLLRRTNAKLEATNYAYGSAVPVGYLASITSPPVDGVSAITRFAYDDYRRVRIVTNEPDQYTMTSEYDDLDRQTKLTYPDKTFEQFKYTDNDTGAMTLDLTGSRDRLGRWTYRRYNANQQMTLITDPLTRPTVFEWCACGALESIEDPKHQKTTFKRDIQNRVYQKVFADLTTINYLFEGQSGPNTIGKSSRLMSSTDALSRRTNYTYYKDDNIKDISYSDSSGGPLSPPTPSVIFTYDPNYNRLATMIDGTGQTTYTYYQITSTPAVGAGMLQTVDGPLTNDTIAYTYDELGRVFDQSINGVAETTHYDPLGRLANTTNALGLFSRSYEGATPRLKTLTYPNGQTANYDYFASNDDDRRLQTINNLTSGTVSLSRFDYAYDDGGDITRMDSVLGVLAYQRWYVQDAAQQLRSVSNTFDPNLAALRVDYGYDDGANRTNDRTYNALGSPNNGTLNSYPAQANVLNQLDSFATSTNGVSGPLNPLVYDLVGNLTNDGQGKTLEWDAVNRLVAINYLATGARTEFTYDGLGRRVKMLEYGPGLTAIVQPIDDTYSTFTGEPVTLPSGDYTLRFEGLEDSAPAISLIDSVSLSNVLLGNGDFESPDVSGERGAYEYNPSDSFWTYYKKAGIASNGSDFTIYNPSPPDGGQVGFVQGKSALSQTWTVAPGTYTLSFVAAQSRSVNEIDQRMQVSLRPSSGAITKRFVWCGNSICEERASNGTTVAKRFFDQGEQRFGGSDAGNYYYSRDHLGSIRELTDSTGALMARYDYDAYGKSVVLSGNMKVDFGYTGHYLHAPSGLNLTFYRAYNPALGRWLSRDPIGEAGGVNLYGYVGNDPLNEIDPLGLDARTVSMQIGFYRFSVSFHVPSTDYLPGEADHEAQHRYDWWYYPSMPGWIAEQRGFQAQLAFIQKRRAELKAMECYPDLWKELTSPDGELSVMDRAALDYRHMVKNESSQWYWNTYARHFWEKKVE
jgi:RHS repeat-associated protein